MKDRISDKLMAHTAPVTPSAQLAGSPIANAIQLEMQAAVNTEAGHSMARRTVAGPKNALQKIDPNATTGSR